ncbi:hypothetical protein SOVF_116960 [Spinacia oleracea]|nr:hypothetical protein SOVF_116960 [Spinacia oleracea]
MAKSALLKPISSLSHDIIPHIMPFFHQTVQQYGKDSFMWFGRKPRVNITNPELIREILNKYDVYMKKAPGKKTTFGLAMRDGQDWAKVRRIINPAFHLEKLKNMVPTMEICCDIMIQKWEEMVALTGSAEVDVYSSLSSCTGDVIARTAFGSSYEEGKRLFELQNEALGLAFQGMRSMSHYIPGSRYFPTKINLRKKKLKREIEEIVKSLVDNKLKLKQTGDTKHQNNLLSIMLESNEKEIEENGVGLPMEELVDECKLFFVAGQDTTSSLLTWTLILLCQNQDWQTKAREEVFLHFGKDYSNTPHDYEGLNRLKIMSMIINETLRLYPSITSLSRLIHQNTELKQLTLLPNMEVHLPTILVHRDQELWGNDANEFNPNRFSEGVLKASKIPGSFMPFGGGPRICIGQNFALIEAKLALTKILQHFSFELSPSYVHAPLLLADRLTYVMLLKKKSNDRENDEEACREQNFLMYGNVLTCFAFKKNMYT